MRDPDVGHRWHSKAAQGITLPRADQAGVVAMKHDGRTKIRVRPHFSTRISS
jgi:hypothetical protein